MSSVLIPEAECTMAFGGAATGIMKAKEQHLVTGSIR